MTSTGTPRVAPEAPGRLGVASPVEQLLPYLAELDTWRAERREELDRIDAAALRAADGATYTSDITLAMAIWQSVTKRYERLTALWDSGRAGERQREEMSRLIWGSGPASGMPAQNAAAMGGMGLSLVEATRLSDALTTALRARLAFDPVAADVAARLAAVRAGLQRSTQLVTEASITPDLEALRRRLDSATKTASQGGDVTGPLGFLEADVARAERDLIVSTANHRGLSRDFRATLLRRNELSAQEGRIRELAARCAAEVTPIPRMAVPDVEALGKVPQTRAELDAFRARLDTVTRALDMVRAAYSKPLAERDELVSRLDAFIAKARSTRADQGPFQAALTAAAERGQAVLASRPCPLPAARDCVMAYQYLLSAAGNLPPGDQTGHQG